MVPELEAAQWEQRAHRIKNGLDKSMLATLEERGFVKDVAGYAVRLFAQKQPLTGCVEADSSSTGSSRKSQLEHTSV
jgi:hypothetical protein